LPTKAHPAKADQSPPGQRPQQRPAAPMAPTWSWGVRHGPRGPTPPQWGRPLPGLPADSL